MFLVDRNSAWQSVTDSDVIGVQKGSIINSLCLTMFRLNLPITSPIGEQEGAICILASTFLFIICGYLCGFMCTLMYGMHSESRTVAGFVVYGSMCGCLYDLMRG